MAVSMMGDVRTENSSESQIQGVVLHDGISSRKAGRQPKDTSFVTLPDLLGTVPIDLNLRSPCIWGLVSTSWFSSCAWSDPHQREVRQENAQSWRGSRRRLPSQNLGPDLFCTPVHEIKRNQSVWSRWGWRAYGKKIEERSQWPSLSSATRLTAELVGPAGTNMVRFWILSRKPSFSRLNTTLLPPRRQRPSDQSIGRTTNRSSIIYQEPNHTSIQRRKQAMIAAAEPRLPSGQKPELHSGGRPSAL